jgi:hypothetical protein
MSRLYACLALGIGLLLQTATGADPERVFTARTGETLRLFDSPCESRLILGIAKPLYKARLKRALYRDAKGAGEVEGCWLEVDGEANMMFEDFDTYVLPLDSFKPAGALRPLPGQQETSSGHVQAGIRG